MKDQLNDSVNTITLETAQSWVKGWRAHLPQVDSKTFTTLNAFLIPTDDITDIINNNKGVVSVRAYLGYDGIEYKLMIVGVDANDNDLIDEAGHHIYDFTKPCPVRCDVNSPLFKLP